MAENPYDSMLPPTRLDRAVDDAIAVVNAQPYTDADREADVENAMRWTAVEAARAAAGRHAVVLPVKTAEAVLALLEGRYDGPLTDTLVQRLVADAIAKVQA